MSEQPSLPAGAVEVLRAWLAGDDLECSVRAGVFADPALWGRLLADVAQNIADGLQQEEGRQPADTLRAIRDAFAAELADSLGESP